MSFPSLAGARMPHTLFEVASWHLAGGTISESLPLSSGNVGYTFAQWPLIDLISSIDVGGGGEIVRSHETYLTSTTSMTAGTTYADAIALPRIAARAATLSGIISSGGTDVWRDLSAQEWSWWVNVGGSISEVVTGTILIELALYDGFGGIGEIVASGQYTMTTTRVP